MTFTEVLDIVKKVISNSIVKSAIVILISFAAYKLLSAFLNARGKKLKKLDRKKGQTYINLINSTVKYAVLIIAFFSLLSVNNVNISSMLAGLGIAGIILGVAVQDALKDVIRGFDIVSDDYFKVGDLISINGKEGIVTLIGIKTTKIKEIKTDNIISIPNREIASAALVSNIVYIEVPMPYETPLERAESVVLQICRTAEKNSNIKECKYMSVNKLDDSAIKYMIKLNLADNRKKLQTTRDAHRVILDTMAQSGISVPYNQIDVHNK